MAGKIAQLNKLRRICLALPEAIESVKWGKPHFCVREKIFAGCDEDGERIVVSFKLETAKAKAIVHMPGFSRAPYVGHKGWVSLDLSVFADWSAIKDLIGESYRLIAPKACLEKLSSGNVPNPIADKKSSLESAKKKLKSAVKHLRKK